MNFYLKILLNLTGSFILVLVLTAFVFEPETPKLKPAAQRILERNLSIIIGYKGEPINKEVDPTPPAAIYY